eukprot:SAG11_NODE_30247_length_302_cov_2.241379_1_plen_48_part_01
MAYRNCFTPNEQNFERNAVTNGTMVDYTIDQEAENANFDGATFINTGK